jgi:cytochrome c oxidase subunit 4
VSGGREQAHPARPLRLYAGVLVALLVLTGLTVAAAERDFGALNTVIALGIAVVKGLLVLLFFMHVRWSSPVVWLFAAVGFAFLVLLVVGTLEDYGSREWLDVYGPRAVPR